MATRDSKVGITLEATNRASGAIEQVKKGLSGLDGAAGLATKGMAGLAGAFTAGAVISFAQNIGGAVVQMAQLAGQSQLVASSMQGLAASFGQSSDEMLNALKRASNGTIAEYDLMLGANKAMMLGVAQNADQLEGIMKVALSRGAAMGLSTTQAFDNLVTGLGRGSALILDNLGITMDSLRVAEESYAASVGKTTEALTDQEKKQAMVNAVLKEAESVDLSNVDGMAQSFAQAQAAVTDMKAALGELFGPVIEAAARGVTNFAEGVTNVKEAVAEAMAEPAKQSIDQQIDAAAARLDVASRAYMDVQSQMAYGDLARLQALAQAGASVEMLSGETAAYYAMLQEVMRAEADLTALLVARAAASRSSPQLEMLEEQRARAEAARLAWEAERAAAQQNAAAIVAASAQAWGAANEQIAAITSGWAEKLFPQMGFEAFEVAAQAAANYRTQLEILTQSGYTLEQALIAVEAAANSDLDALLNAGAAAGDAAVKSDNLAAAAQRAGLEVQKLGSAAGGASGGLAALNAEAIGAANALYEVENAARRAQAAVTAQALGSLKATALQAAGTLGVNEAMQEYETNARSLQQVSGYLAKSGMDQTEIEFQLAAMTDRMTGATIDRVRAIEAEAEAATRATGSSGGGGVKGYAGALQEANIAGQNLTYTLGGLQSKVSGALSGALNLDVGVKPEDFLPREDAINENARRLADIMVNGFKDQSWLEEFKTEVPDVFAALAESGNPQQAAAQMLKNFQDGLLPGLIDKEAVKEKVKRAIIGDANMAALAQEITAELAAELGQNPAQLGGLVNQAMGRGAADSDINGEVLTQLKSQNFLNGVNKAGYDAGVNWGASFLTNVGDNVPAQLLDILATLVAPIVKQKNADDEGRKGAQ
jgi:BMFP domain-containing protein YqiC